MSPCAYLAVIALGSATAVVATDLWDLPPLRYSDTPSTDPIAKAGPAIKGSTPMETLRFVLKLLDIPEESQVLVFSKTSKQNALIHPGNPRALFFNENSYVGYVPGGNIEVIAHDDLLGSVFHVIVPGDGDRAPIITRDTSDCLSCHGTARTESAPGVLVRSVFPDKDGTPLLPLGTFQTDHHSPLKERWGGYYVTGRSSLPHLGNRTFETSNRRDFPDSPAELGSLQGKIDVARYPRATSDIVALMVLEHQCSVHNQLTAAAMNYRRIHWLQKSLSPNEDPDLGAAGRHADESACKILSLLLFENEAQLGENGIEGDPAFQEAFTHRFPRTKDGRSLADFQLNERIFKYRCSYMIYSNSFKTLPERVKSAVIAGLRTFLKSDPAPENHPEIGSAERRKIATILSETLPAWSGK